MADNFEIPASAEVHDAIDGLQALTQFARLASGADMAIAFEATEAGLATPLAAAPDPPPEPFSLDDTRLEEMDRSMGPVQLGRLRLPSTILLALGRPVNDVHFIPTPIPEAPRSGILLLWTAQGVRHCTCSFRSDIEQGVPTLTRVFAQMLTDRRRAMERRLMSERFYDLFESVPSGIVVLSGNGGAGMVNKPAAALLGITAGEIEAAMLAAPMRALRQSCSNASQLQAAYGAVMGDVDYAVTILWDLGNRQFEVDTHPLLGDGRKGRIWLFNDVTAQRRIEQELRTLAATDPLTGLLNRRQFAENGGTLLLQAQSDMRQLSVLMIDIDHFKVINDRYGHHVGDVVLQVLVERCRANLRDQDLMARLGGEEFAIMLPGTAASEATAIAERLRAAIADTPIAVDDQEIDVQVSIGGTTWQSNNQTLDELLGRTDRALYAAKQAGRNMIVFE